MKKVSFASDYQEGAHEAIIKRLVETNLMQTDGYGMDEFCQSAREKIRDACQCPSAKVDFLIGGTQTNATVIDALLRSYQGVIAPDSGHISVHEAGAIELCGHKVLQVPHQLGKISAEAIQGCLENFQHDGNRDHMVMPGMVYISQPTEYGTLYSLEELTAISKVCRSYRVTLYVDGARLAYALASPQNTVTLADLARLCDAFYIGGTKCGALLAKGRLLGIQFDTLFTDHLYDHIGKHAVMAAGRIQELLRAKGFEMAFDSPTNQVFVKLENSMMKKLSQDIGFSFWEAVDDSHTIVRFATSWATRDEDIHTLEKILEGNIQ